MPDPTSEPSPDAVDAPDAVEAAYRALVDELSERYADRVDRPRVEQYVREARAALEPAASIPDFLPVLVRKQVRDRLHVEAATTGETLHHVPVVTFVCAHGTGRSQLAAALAAHLGGDHVHVRAGGEHPEGGLEPAVVAALRERGVDLVEPFDPGPRADVVQAADVIVEIGGRRSELYGLRTVRWEVADPRGATLEEVRGIRNELEARVRDLLRDLAVPVRV